MSMIEVDPKLFIKCRLCLEDSGTYQIVPVIREQISYCFDINVEPFDGLPQLICKKCQNILSYYSKTKESYIEKQKNLKKGNTGNGNNVMVTKPAVGKKFDYTRPSHKRKNSDTAPNNNIKQRKEIETLLESSDSECTSKSKDNLVTKESLPVSERKEDCRTENNLDIQKSSLLSGSEEGWKTENIHGIKESSSLSKTDQSWKCEFQKTFSCRLCNKQLPKYRAMKHHANKHKYLKTKYADVFKKYCIVELPKIDTTPNVTGSMKKVVYSKNKIISNVTSLDYLVSYKRIPTANVHHSDDGSQNLDECSDTSSITRVGKRSRRYRRIYSNSSTDTVVLENKIKKSDIDYEPDNKPQNECINIDDTDSDSEKNKQVQTKVKNKKGTKADAIAKLIATTHKTYLAKHGKPEKPSFEQLNRKVTSIGRQIINKPGFNCARLIKYMEHMNLNVIWITRSPANVTNNSNYIKIIPRQRNPNEKKNNDFEGYKFRYSEAKPVNRKEDHMKDISDPPSDGVDFPGSIDASDTELSASVAVAADVSCTNITSKSSFEEESRSAKKLRKKNAANTIKANGATEVKNIVSNPPIVPRTSIVAIAPMVSSAVELSSVVESTVALEKPGNQYSVTVQAKDNVQEKSEASVASDAILYSNTAADTRKLLNANPVANPRQLPKKFSETKKDKAKYVVSMPTLEINPDELSAEVTSDFRNEMQMPIITMTRSLAVPEGDIFPISDKSLNKNLNSDFVTTNNENAQISAAPRIKVKSAAELMSQETLNRMKQPTAVVGHTMTPNGAGIHDVAQLTINDVRSISTDSDDINTSDDYVILDTVELPNTKSNSPFKYFKALLQMHNIILLDTDVTLTGDFHTLIRFKVLYKQETKDQPVILCLSLSCLNNIFCLKIKDRNEVNINMTKISANWQWEILKIYRGEVVSKLMCNAQKISSEVFDNTNRFLCLLKSINFILK